MESRPVVLNPDCPTPYLTWYSCAYTYFRGDTADCLRVHSKVLADTCTSHACRSVQEGSVRACDPTCVPAPHNEARWAETSGRTNGTVRNIGWMKNTSRSFHSPLICTHISAVLIPHRICHSFPERASPFTGQAVLLMLDDHLASKRPSRLP